MAHTASFVNNTLMVFDETDRKILEQPFNPFTLQPWASEEDAMSWWGSVNPAYEQAPENPDPAGEEPVVQPIEESQQQTSTE